jgi:TPR repeat protein
VLERAKQNKPDAIHAIGCKYVRIEHHEKALRWLGTSVALGFKESQLELGHLFAKAGQDEYALEWYLQAKRNDLITDPFCIAKILLKQERYNEARQYFQESASLGNNDAQFQLGLLFYNGWCLDRYKNFNSLKNHYINMDKRLAKGWFVKSAKDGNREAACYVGRIYENGEGVCVDKYRALVWYYQSKSEGYQPANKCIDLLYKQGYIHIPQG